MVPLPEPHHVLLLRSLLEPFLLILLAGCLGVLLGNRTSSVRRVRVGVLCVGIYLTAVLLVSAYFVASMDRASYPV